MSPVQPEGIETQTPVWTYPDGQMLETLDGCRLGLGSALGRKSERTTETESLPNLSLATSILESMSVENWESDGDQGGQDSQETTDAVRTCRPTSGNSAVSPRPETESRRHLQTAI